MTLADTLLPIVRAVRGIPGELGLRPVSVELVETAYSGTMTGRGSPAPVYTALTEGGGYPPRCRQLKTDEIALSQYSVGTIMIGAITPQHAVDGVLVGCDVRKLLAWEAGTGDTLHVQVTRRGGPVEKFRIRAVDKSKALSIYVTAEPVGGTPV